MKKGLKSFAHGFMGTIAGFVLLAGIYAIDKGVEQIENLNTQMKRVEQALTDLEGIDI